MVAIYFIKTGLTVLLLLLLFSVQSAAVELSGKAKTVPENGLIELLGKEILLHGIQIISLNATCKGSNGEWSCGKHAWRELKNKLDSGPVYCKLFSDEKYSERNPELAKCLLKKENLSNWLVSRGWALTNKETDEFLASQCLHVVEMCRYSCACCIQLQFSFLYEYEFLISFQLLA